VVDRRALPEATRGSRTPLWRAARLRAKVQRHEPRDMQDGGAVEALDTPRRQRSPRAGRRAMGTAMPEIAGRGSWGRRHTLVALCVAALFLAYTDRVNLAVAALAMQAEFHWSQTVKGLVLSSFFVGYMLFQIGAGALARRFGGKRVLAVAVAWWSAFTLLTPLAASLSVGVLVAARIGLGLGEAAVMPATYELYSRWVPPAERGRAIGRLLSGIPLGQIVGFIATGWLTARFGWPASFYLFGVLGLAWAGYWLLLVVNDPADDPRVGASERQLLASCAATRLGADRPRTPWRLFLRQPPVWALVAAHFAHNWTLYMLVSWLPSYFRESHGLGIASSGLFSAGPWATYFAALQLTGAWSDAAIARGLRTISVRRLATCGGLMAASACLLALRAVDSPVLALTLICVATASIGVAASGFTSVPLDLSPRHAPVLIGFSNTLATIPGIAGVAITGWLVDVTHTYSAAFLVSALCSVGGALVFLRYSSAQEIAA
jgi:MFS transporter, ACS family, solute carrier family 17 (sodium-dependent inorganic phosphate cotransporter), other